MAQNFVMWKKMKHYNMEIWKGLFLSKETDLLMLNIIPLTYMILLKVIAI